VREATRLAVAAITGSRIHVLEGHGHFAHRARPALVADVIRRFAFAD
jgi:pimeloyl-ACP methyl ester carboxylesterase